MSRPRLFHVSESATIPVFEPRPAPATSRRAGESLVWAIAEDSLYLYLLPRDCPRLGFYASATTTPADSQRFLALTAARHIVAIEAAWLERASVTPLYLYELPAESFVLEDEGAGYYVSRERLEPLSVSKLEQPLTALLARDTELRVVPSLWLLHDAVTASSLGFSCIRMRNAAPRF